MQFTHLRGDTQDIMNCAIKDDTGLNDFQKLPNHHGVAIPRVGIERFRIPLKFKRSDGHIISHDVEASMFVYLDSHKTGVNMSRFCTILQEEAENCVNQEFFKKILYRYQSDLRDSQQEELIKSAEIILSFNYATKQKSLRSENWGWQYYPCTLKAAISSDQSVKMSLSLDYEYSSTCPCSLSMAKQYEKDFRDGLTNLGNGIATAHSQRSNANVRVDYSIQTDFWLEDLIALLRKALPTETQSLVKRIDEQAFAISNLGAGAAVASVVFVILLGVSGIFIYFSPKDHG